MPDRKKTDSEYGLAPEVSDRRPKKRRKKKKSHVLAVIIILLLIVAVGMIGAGVYLVWFKNADAFERQSTEEDIADEYIDDLILQLRDPEAYAEKMAEKESEAEAEAETDISELWYRDADGGYWFVDSDGNFWYGTESGEWLKAEDDEVPTKTVSNAPMDGSDPDNVESADEESDVSSSVGYFYRSASDKWYFLADIDGEETSSSWIEVEGPAALIENGMKIVSEIRLKILHSLFGSEEETEPDYASDDMDYTDENYYSRDGVVYTPDYAQGEIDCVLEVPSVEIRRGVYTGTWDQINYDLDIWMVTAARPDYVLGETHYCIYGHNHTVQNLSFNRLQKVQVGERFYLTSSTGRYIYTITNVFAVSREDATTDYVNNFDLGSDKCYLITCGRDDGVRNYRYLDLIVEGTLEEHMTLEEYAESIGK